MHMHPKTYFITASEKSTLLIIKRNANCGIITADDSDIYAAMKGKALHVTVSFAEVDEGETMAKPRLTSKCKYKNKIIQMQKNFVTHNKCTTFPHFKSSNSIGCERNR